MEQPGELETFLATLWSAIQADYDPAAQEEGKPRRKSAIEKRLASHPFVLGAAITVGKNNAELKPFTRRMLIATVRKNELAFKELYAEVMKDADVAQEARAERQDIAGPADIKNPKLRGWDDMTLGERTAVLNRVTDKKVRERIESEGITDREIAEYIGRLEADRTRLADREKQLDQGRENNTGLYDALKSAREVAALRPPRFWLHWYDGREIPPQRRTGEGMGRPPGGTMEIRNLMEESVTVMVDELFEFENREKRLGFCTCGQCRLDVICYVLNRVKPEYVVSSRGLAYRERDSLDKVQRRADVISLAKEGWSRVSHQPRATADHHASRVAHDLPAGPAYNFPTLMGRAFNGLNFEPFASGEVALRIDGDMVHMVDNNWQNPYVLAQATAGTYLFWPRPASAATEGDTRTFSCELHVSVPGFEDVSHFFELPLRAEGGARAEFSMQNVHKVQDLILFPTGTDADLED